jgi:3-deoxy-7-phosphoheptulonate synthase
LGNSLLSPSGQILPLDREMSANGNVKRARCDAATPTFEPLISAALIKQDYKLTEKADSTNTQAVAEVQAVLEGRDDRLIVIVGPCSIHDVAAAKEYAGKLATLKAQHAGELVVIMRVYFEKPRTTVGWKGLINDPNLDGTFDVNKGLRTARELLIDVNGLGVPAATEFLDLVTPPYISDLICWGAIGARTTESQGHREMVSALPCPIGFKNGTSGDVQIAVDACGASCRPHSFLAVAPSGMAAVVKSAGNAHCHLVLRGGSDGPNYAAEHVAVAAEKMTKGKIKPNIVIDCSHGNSLKKFENQPKVCQEIGEQMAKGGNGKLIVGVMIESNLVEGNQKVDANPRIYGKSVTDACVGWPATETMLAGLAAAVQKRRALI